MNEATIAQQRLRRIKNALSSSDFAAIVLFDPVNIRYATGSRNMQVWTMHNLCRYLILLNDGPVVLFDLPSSAHLSAHLDTIDDVRPSLTVDYMMVAERGEEMAARWGRELADLVASGPAAKSRGRTRRTGADRWETPDATRASHQVGR